MAVDAAVLRALTLPTRLAAERPVTFSEVVRDPAERPGAPSRGARGRTVSEERLFEEAVLRRALRLDPDEHPRLDPAALAATAADAEHARFARAALAAVALLAVLPVWTLARVLLALAMDPGALVDPDAAAAMAVVTSVHSLSLLAEPATALAIVTGAAVIALLERRERIHVVHAS